ncbi:MAG: Concanavalin A-like lectin/glucanase superfamily [Bacteroidota bacterium]|jgi:hypothetical protein
MAYFLSLNGFCSAARASILEQYVDGEDPNKTLVRDLRVDNNGNYQSHKFYVGSRAGSSYFFNGSIAKVLLYDRVLTAEEIQQNLDAIGVAYGL